jgi:hypothetical protein
MPHDLSKKVQIRFCRAAMCKRVFASVAAGSSLFVTRPVFRQASGGRPSSHQKQADDKEPVSILEVGEATSWNSMGRNNLCTQCSRGDLSSVFGLPMLRGNGGSFRDIVETFGGDLNLETIHKLRNGPSETQQREFPLGKVLFDSCRRRINAL